MDQISRDIYQHPLLGFLIERVFPNFHIGHALRGLRSREGLTQKKLAEIIGVKPSHISEMENGKRPIGKEMAKRLAKALRTDYKIFLKAYLEELSHRERGQIF